MPGTFFHFRLLIFKLFYSEKCFCLNFHPILCYSQLFTCFSFCVLSVLEDGPAAWEPTE